MISPLSIIGAMYMLAAGTGGKSKQEILEALDFRDVKEDLAPFHAYKNLIAGLVNDNPDTYTLNIGNFLIIIYHRRRFWPDFCTKSDFLNNFFKQRRRILLKRRN